MTRRLYVVWRRLIQRNQSFTIRATHFALPKCVSLPLTCDTAWWVGTRRYLTSTPCNPYSIQLRWLHPQMYPQLSQVATTLRSWRGPSVNLACPPSLLKLTLSSRSLNFDNISQLWQKKKTHLMNIISTQTYISKKERQSDGERRREAKEGKVKEREREERERQTFQYYTVQYKIHNIINNIVAATTWRSNRTLHQSWGNFRKPTNKRRKKEENREQSKPDKRKPKKIKNGRRRQNRRKKISEKLAQLRRRKTTTGKKKHFSNLRVTLQLLLHTTL